MLPSCATPAPYLVTGATGQASSDTITKTAHGLTNGTALQFVTLTGGTGLTVATTYYVVGTAADTYQVAATTGGSAVDITGDYSVVTYSCLAAIPDGWVHRLAYLTGWDCWASGKGATGYVNPGAGVRFLDRLNEVTDNAPDVVIFAGGINDVSYTYAQVSAAALACFQQVRSTLPKVPILVLPAFWPKDITTAAASQATTNDAIQAAAAQVSNTTWVPMFPLALISPNPLAGTATTLSAQASSGATSLSCPINYATGTILRIGTAGTTTQEYRKVTSTSGGGPYTINFNGTGGGGALGVTHASGDPVTPVGPNIYTGSGKQGTTTGIGNSDRYTGSDGTHPTVAGHLNIAVQTFREIVALISAA